MGNSTHLKILALGLLLACTCSISYGHTTAQVTVTENDTGDSPPDTKNGIANLDGNYSTNDMYVPYYLKNQLNEF